MFCGGARVIVHFTHNTTCPPVLSCARVKLRLYITAVAEILAIVHQYDKLPLILLQLHVPV